MEKKQIQNYFKESRWYRFIRNIVYLLCMTVITFVFHSGLFILWQKPSSGNSYESYSLPTSLLIGLIGGFLLGFLVLTQIEVSYDRWVASRKKS